MTETVQPGYLPHPFGKNRGRDMIPGSIPENGSAQPVSPDREPAEGDGLVGFIARGFAGLAGHLDHLGNLQGTAYLEKRTGLRGSQRLFH